MDLNKLRELAETHLPVPVEAAQIAHETYCPRIGGPVELYDGTCPECGWRYRLSTHSAVSVHPEDLHALIEEVDRLRARAEKAEANYAFMVERAANQHLDGYRELGARVAAAENESVYDGEPVVCPDCGCAGTASVDEEEAYIVWREDESLTDAALAGLRRLLRVTP